MCISKLSLRKTKVFLERIFNMNTSKCSTRTKSNQYNCEGTLSESGLGNDARAIEEA